MQTDLKGTSLELYIYGEIVDDGDTASYGIEGIAPLDVVNALKAFPQATELVVYINSPGGSVFGGAAIYNVLNRFAGQKRVVIDGMALSAASVIAMAGDTISIAENALLMIHEPWMMVLGDRETLLTAAASLEKASISIRDTYVARTGQTTEQIAAWMQAETWFTAADALAANLVTEIVPAKQLSNAVDLKKFGYKNIPTTTPVTPSSSDDGNTAIVRELDSWLQSYKGKL